MKVIEDRSNSARTASALSTSNGHAPSAAKDVYVYLAGVGSVGRTLLEQIDAMPENGYRLRLIGACTSHRAVWSTGGVPTARVEQELHKGKRSDWSEILPRLQRERSVPLIFVDATGSLEVARYYEQLLQSGVHIVTPSKLANTQTQAYFNRLQDAAAEQDVQFRYETTVGAGLPIVQTVQDLVATGDRIREIRGAVSGTLTFLFSALRDGASFSEAVRTAVERGYAEPDVRDDLSGEDVLRKFITLARTAGCEIERDEIDVESLVPAALKEVKSNVFLSEMDAFDAAWSRRTSRAEAEGAVLQYVGCFSAGTVEVGVQAVPASSPLGRLGGTDNLVEIYTDRYADAPLVIRGPGAGPEVTAAGVLSDLLKVARSVH